MIRKMLPKDKAIYFEMSKAFYDSEAVLHRIPDENFERTFALIMTDNPYAAGYMIESDGNAAGYALVSLMYSNESGGLVLWIEEVYLLAAYRGSGLGKELFRFLETEYDGKAVRFRLEAEAANEHAIGLYGYLGYEELGYVQFYKQK